MSVKTLFLAWQDNEPNQAGFPLLIEFPKLKKAYRSSELFSLFQNRVMNPARPDFAEYLRNLDLTEGADPIEILATNGGSRVTDAYEVFPKIIKDDDGSFACRFFLLSRQACLRRRLLGRQVGRQATKSW